MKDDRYFTREELWAEIKKNPVPYVVLALFFLVWIIGTIIILPYAMNDPMPIDRSIHWFGKMWW